MNYHLTNVLWSRVCVLQYFQFQDLKLPSFKEKPIDERPDLRLQNCMGYSRNRTVDER
jgi:hypothetical protein